MTVEAFNQYTNFKLSTSYFEKLYEYGLESSKKNFNEITIIRIDIYLKAVLARGLKRINNYFIKNYNFNLPPNFEKKFLDIFVFLDSTINFIFREDLSDFFFDPLCKQSSFEEHCQLEILLHCISKMQDIYVEENILYLEEKYDLDLKHLKDDGKSFISTCGMKDRTYNYIFDDKDLIKEFLSIDEQYSELLKMQKINASRIKLLLEEALKSPTQAKWEVYTMFTNKVRDTKVSFASNVRYETLTHDELSEYIYFDNYLAEFMLTFYEFLDLVIIATYSNKATELNLEPIEFSPIKNEDFRGEDLEHYKSLEKFLAQAIQIEQNLVKIRMIDFHGIVF